MLSSQFLRKTRRRKEAQDHPASKWYIRGLNPERQALALKADLRGNAFSFSPLRMMFTVGLLYMAFIMLR